MDTRSRASLALFCVGLIGVVLFHSYGTSKHEGFELASDTVYDLAIPPEAYDSIQVSDAIDGKELRIGEVYGKLRGALASNVQLDRQGMDGVIKGALGGEWAVVYFNDDGKKIDVVVKRPAKMYGILFTVPKGVSWQPEMIGYVMSDKIDLPRPSGPGDIAFAGWPLKNDTLAGPATTLAPAPAPAGVADAAPVPIIDTEHVPLNPTVDKFETTTHPWQPEIDSAEWPFKDESLVGPEPVGPHRPEN